MRAYWQTYSKSKLDNKIQADVESALTQYKDEIYEKVEWDVFKQAMAVCFIALEWMGWKRKRLRKFYGQVEEVCRMMETGIMGREVTTRDALNHLKDAYGIEFKESLCDDQAENERR